MTKIHSKDIPLHTFILIDEIDNHLILDNLIKDIYQNNDFFGHTNVKAKHSQFKFLVDNKNFHDFLHLIKKQIHFIFKDNFVLEDCWSNIYNNDDYAEEHTHTGSNAFSGILYLTDGPGPGTYFKDYDLIVPEKKGRFVLFHGHLKHEVKKFNYTKDRITVAFNCIRVGWISKDQKVLVVK